MSAPLVYVASPITGDPWGCVPRAIEAARILRNHEFQAVLPQLSVFQEMHDPRPHEAWVSDGINLLSRCDGLYRLHGESTGADIEVGWARALSVPVFMENHDGTILLTPYAEWRERVIAHHEAIQAAVKAAEL